MTWSVGHVGMVSDTQDKKMQDWILAVAEPATGAVLWQSIVWTN